MNDGPKYFPKYLGGTYYPHFMAAAVGLEPTKMHGSKPCAFTAWLHRYIKQKVGIEPTALPNYYGIEPHGQLSHSTIELLLLICGGKGETRTLAP